MRNASNAMFVFLNLFFEKLFFKFFCVCLPLKKLINRKHFPVKEKLDHKQRGTRGPIIGLDGLA